jgi:XTP/dITP diphosphohydrolase
MTKELKLLIATSNKGKIREIQRILSENLLGLQISLISLADLGITANAPENGKTFLENAAEKSVFYSKLAPELYTVAEDSGLSVDALDGAPGIYSARYSGPDATDDKNIDKLLHNLKGQPNRQAKFVTAVSISLDGRLLKSFLGEAQGEIIDEKRGEHGFGYDPVFYYPPLQKTFAQLTTSEKNSISHRSRALETFKQYLPQLTVN